MIAASALAVIPESSDRLPGAGEVAREDAFSNTAADREGGSVGVLEPLFVLLLRPARLLAAARDATGITSNPPTTAPSADAPPMAPVLDSLSQLSAPCAGVGDASLGIDLLTMYSLARRVRALGDRDSESSEGTRSNAGTGEELPLEGRACGIAVAMVTPAGV